MGVRELLELPSNGVPDLTPEMRMAGDLAAQRAAQKTRDEITKQGAASGLTSEKRAAFKIEVTFGAGRTTKGPNLLGIQVWESGKRLNGGGDDLAFWCLSNDLTQPAGCGGIITSQYIKGGIAYCPHCERGVNHDLLTNMKIGRIATKNLAETCEKLFRQLDSNADLYLKYHKTDIRYAAMEQAKGVAVARRLRGMHIYPLKNILKDTAFGASVTGRFLAFLTS